jgi:hypothetical protein
MPSFAAGEGLSPTGMSGAQLATNGIDEISATTNAVVVIAATSPCRCQRDRPCQRPSFAAGEGLSPAGMSGAKFVTNGINEISATTNAVIAITTTSLNRCQRDRPCQRRRSQLEQGRKQGLERGLLIGPIRTLQKVLGQLVAAEDSLALQSLEDLQTLAGQTQAAPASRPLHPGNGGKASRTFPYFVPRGSFR